MSRASARLVAHALTLHPRCLQWDPERRLKPDPAMRHPFLRSLAAAQTPRHHTPGSSSSGAGGGGGAHIRQVSYSNGTRKSLVGSGSAAAASAAAGGTAARSGTGTAASSVTTPQRRAQVS